MSLNEFHVVPARPGHLNHLLDYSGLSGNTLTHRGVISGMIHCRFTDRRAKSCPALVRFRPYSVVEISRSHHFFFSSTSLLLIIPPHYNKF